MVVQSLPGGASGQGVLRGTFGPGPLVEGKGKKKREKKKKGNLGITILPPRRFCFSNSLFFLSAYSTVTLYSHFKF